MPDLVVIIPTRGRPHTVPELVESFRETCREDTHLILAVDEDDPDLETYSDNVRHAIYGAYLTGENEGWKTYTKDPAIWNKVGVCVVDNPTNMVGALNRTARYVLDSVVNQPRAIAFMGDDHRPRTPGWDTAYLEALGAKPGLVYGDDLLQGRSIPTQVAMSTFIVRALDGKMAPDELTHLYVDDYWKNLGVTAGCLTYLPDVVVEHLHPAAGKAQWDDGYRRVNSKAMFSLDGEVIRAYWAMHGSRDVRLVVEAIERETNGAQQV